MRVGVDLDGVLYDFGNSVRRYLDSIGRPYGFKDDAEEPHHWDFYEYWGMDRAEFAQICHDGADAGYIFCGDARPNAAHAIQQIRSMGDTIVIITDRKFGTTPSVSENNTINWLAQHEIPYDEIYFSADKTCVATDVFVEDKLENYDALHQAGTFCVLIDRPWNQDSEEVNAGPRHRIKDIADYPYFVFDYAFGRSLGAKEGIVL